MINGKVSDYYCLTADEQFPVEQELLTLPGHPISPPVFSGVVLLDLLFSV